MTANSTGVYENEIASWRQMMDERLRAEDGWLSLVGLFWLHEGVNTIGSSEATDITLPAGEIPDYLGVIRFSEGQAALQIAATVPVLVDGTLTTATTLRDDQTAGGPSLVQIGSVSFFVIRRGDEYGVRVRDSNNPARLDFSGRKWFPLDERYRVEGRFIAHDKPRTIQIASSTGHPLPMSNPGRVEFTLDGQVLSLEAFASNEHEVWFAFKDGSSGSSTYGAGRFMYAPLGVDGTVGLDFNKSYNPPCAFTPHATCPRPPKDNVLPLEIRAGEYL